MQQSLSEVAMNRSATVSVFFIFSLLVVLLVVLPLLVSAVRSMSSLAAV
jgi:hypothetical protein